MNQGGRLLHGVEVGAGAVVSVLAIVLSYRFCTEAGPLWRDEASTVHLATLPRYADLLRALHFDSAPALYPTILRAWATPWNPADDVVFRLFSLLVAAGLVAAVWITARSIAIGAPLLTLVLFDLHRTVLQTVGSLKPYGLGAVFLVLAFGAIGTMLALPSRRTALWAAAAMILALQTLYHNAVLLLGVCAAAVAVKAISRDWKAARLVAVTGAIALLSLLPYAGVVAQSRDWRPLNQIETNTGRLLRQLVEIFSDWNGRLMILWALVVVAAVVASALVLRSAGRSAPDRERVAYALLTLLFAGTLYLAFLRLVSRNAEPWHLAPLMVLVALCLDVMISRPLTFRWLRLGLAGVAALVLVPTSVLWVGVRQTNIDLLATYLEGSAQPGDAIVVTPWFLGVTFNRYYHGSVPWITIPPIEDLTIHRYDLLKARMTARDPLTPVYRVMSSALESGHRVWLVGGLQFPAPGDVAVPLPPAPAAPSGWRDSPYYLAWSREAGQFVQNRSVRLGVVDVQAGQPVWPAEDIVLLMAEGWRAPGGQR